MIGARFDALYGFTSFHIVRRMSLQSFHTMRAMIARSVLLLALLLAGMVPDGMMRQAGPDGMRLVLCTADGVQEVWLSEDGEAVPVEPNQSGDAAHQPHCVQVNLIAQAAAVPVAVPREISVGRVEHAQATHQLYFREVAGDSRWTRAPPSMA